MSVLPKVSDIQAVQYDYFPTVWQAIVWRNWGYVPVERIAKTLDTSCENIREAAKGLGLNPEEPVQELWDKRGFLTLIRDNWHLCTYEQLLTLLNLTEESLAFTLKEDDFMWVKLGNYKPCVEPTKYEPQTEEQLEKTNKIAELFKNRFPECDRISDNGFAFLNAFYEPLTEDEWKEVEKFEVSETAGLRMVYPYFSLYGDTLIDEEHDPYPDRLLFEYAKAGINGIWMQGILYQLVEFPFDSSVSEGWEIRIRSLN